MELEKFLRQIEQRDDHVPPSSLYAGKAGDVLFHLAMDDGGNYHADRIGEIIDLVTGSIQEMADINSSFCGGIGGAVWLLRFLADAGALELEEGSLDDIYDFITRDAVYMLSEGNFDFLHGAGGILLTLLSDAEVNRTRLTIVAEHFFQARQEIEGRMIWGRQKGGISPEVSLGLAHGLPSVMVLLSKLYLNDILPEQCKASIYDCYAYILEQRNPDVTEVNFSTFPTIAQPGVPNTYTSRVAWCYGELSIGLGLYVTGTNIGNAGMQALAIELFDRYAGENLLQRKYGIIDTCFCHGSAGVAHLFYRMYANTGKDSYLAAAKRMADVTMEFVFRSGEHPNYTTFQGDKWVVDNTLLNGVSGVALAMATIQNNQKSRWDEAFLLS